MMVIFNNFVKCRECKDVTRILKAERAFQEVDIAYGNEHSRTNAACETAVLLKKRKYIV